MLISIFISAFVISSYHFGIEQGFIKESLVCDLNSTSVNLTKESLLIELKQKTVSCKDVTFKIFGLSLATINIFISLIISVIIIKLFLSYEKNK
jgi:disulfide bond formation protein DsbB